MVHFKIIKINMYRPLTFCTWSNIGRSTGWWHLWNLIARPSTKVLNSELIDSSHIYGPRTKPVLGRSTCCSYWQGYIGLRFIYLFWVCAFIFFSYTVVIHMVCYFYHTHHGCGDMCGQRDYTVPDVRGTQTNEWDALRNLSQVYWICS